MPSDNTTSTARRRLMQGAAAGLVTTVATRALGQASGTEATGTAGATPLADPRGLYPHPPFPAQEQPWPGLAGRMTPRPDHGETSYLGTGRLTGRHALITGGDSGIGRAAAIAFAREGADVAIVYLPAEEPDAREVVQIIRAAGRKAVALPGDIRNETFCQALVVNALQQMGGLDRTAGRNRAAVCAARINAGKLRDRPGIRRVGRRGAAVTAPHFRSVSSPDVRAGC